MASSKQSPAKKAYHNEIKNLFAKAQKREIAMLTSSWRGYKTYVRKTQETERINHSPRVIGNRHLTQKRVKYLSPL